MNLKISLCGVYFLQIPSCCHSFLLRGRKCFEMMSSLLKTFIVRNNHVFFSTSMKCTLDSGSISFMDPFSLKLRLSDVQYRKHCRRYFELCFIADLLSHILAFRVLSTVL